MKEITYTKKDISSRLSEQADIPVNVAAKCTDEFFGIIREMLCGDEQFIRIEVRNFGVLEVKPTKAKPRARNPKTNEEIFVPAHKKSHFKPGKLIKQHLNKPI